HSPAEPPPVPPGAVGADALPEAHHPAQPEADPDRAATSAAPPNRAAGLAVLPACAPAAQPDRPGALAWRCGADQPRDYGRRLAEHGLRLGRPPCVSPRA